MKPVTKKDIIIIAAALLAAAVAALVFALTRTAPATVTVYVGDEVYERRSVDDYGTVTVDQGDGRVNVIVIDETGVRMESSTCKNQICVHEGTLDPEKMDSLLLDNWIVCLPNGVSVELSEGE